MNGSPDKPGAHPFASDDTKDNYEAVWSAIRPDYLRDLRGVSQNVNRESVNMGARTVNGSKFDINEATFTLPANAIQDWTLKGARNHPFHLHVYHVQVQGDCGFFEDGEYYDVIAGNCNIRFDINASTTSPYDGRTIMHCHILEHEDQGAMGWLDVEGGAPAPVFPVGYDYSENYVLNSGPTDPPPAAPSELVATTASDTEIDLAWLDNSVDEDQFDIFRSTDNASFDWVNFVGPDATTYTDIGLAGDTTYWYQVRAFKNNGGASAFSNTASAITEASEVGTDLQLGSITVSIVSEGKGQKRGQAVVVVEDNTGSPVTNAVVAGKFQQSFDETIAASDPTGVDGSTMIQTTNTEKGSVSVGFCVTSITHGTLGDWSGEICE